MSDEQFWTRLQEAMELRGLNLSQLADAAGIKYHTLHSAKQRRQSKPKLDQATMLAEALEVQLRWLMTGEGSPTEAGDDVSRSQDFQRVRELWALASPQLKKDILRHLELGTLAELLSPSNAEAAPGLDPEAQKRAP